MTLKKYKRIIIKPTGQSDTVLEILVAGVWYSCDTDCKIQIK